MNQTSLTSGGAPIAARTDVRAALVRLGRSVVVPLFAVATLTAIAYGWSIREEEYLSAEEGLGYALGITGGVLMLSQFLYSLRKKLRFMRHWGKVANWFRVHKAIGVIAPVIILYHSNFSLGSFNSNMALFTMLLVVASGLVGRYIYTKINLMLHGRQATLEQLRKLIDRSREDMKEEFVLTDDVSAYLQEFERDLLTPSTAASRAMWQAMTVGYRARRAYSRTSRALVKALRAQARTEGWERAVRRRRLKIGKRLVDHYVHSVRRVAEFSAYTRLFGLWHVLHIPLFIMLVVSGVVHVVAVHFY